MMQEIAHYIYRRAAVAEDVQIWGHMRDAAGHTFDTVAPPQQDMDKLLGRIVWQFQKHRPGAAICLGMPDNLIDRLVLECSRDLHFVRGGGWIYKGIHIKNVHIEADEILVWAQGSVRLEYHPDPDDPVVCVIDDPDDLLLVRLLHSEKEYTL